MAQLITYPDLSHKYIYIIKIVKISDTVGLRKGSMISLFIYNRDKKLIQQINFKADILFEDTYKTNRNSRSYITGKNKEKEVYDYDFGDLIVADLNFDGKEDIAIKNDSGGNGGPIYNFYVQNDKGLFQGDRYLTNEVRSFPRYVNAKQKTITTQIHANVHQEGKKTFKYNITTKKWRLIKWINVES